jgi:hypothetical protein
LHAYEDLLLYLALQVKKRPRTASADRDRPRGAAIPACKQLAQLPPMMSFARFPKTLNLLGRGADDAGLYWVVFGKATWDTPSI